MRLSSIKLSGFKSFSDQTSLVFPSDRTVLVGPNGCGKSNIIDAIRWVLGASSSSGLRTDSMEDVIFNGTDDNPPRGRAMVEMVFANNKNRLTGKYQDLPEVKIRRVLERERDSKYYINDVPCLRKNITELFAGMGLTGKTDYAIVTQGAVHNIVESNPEYIRTVIEEVADITSYLNKRKDSLNHIRRTKENLRTIHSNLAEMKHRVKALEKQSEMAKVYKDNQDELINLKEQLTLARYNQLMNKKEAKRTSLNQLVQKISDIKNNSASWESQKQEISLTVDNKNKDMIADITKQRELTDQISVIDAGNKYNLKDLNDKEQQLDAIKEESAQISKRLQEQLSKLDEANKELQELKQKQKQILSSSDIYEKSKDKDASQSLNTVRDLEKQINVSANEWQEVINVGMEIHARHKDAEVKLKESLAAQEELSKQIEEMSKRQDTYKDTQKEISNLNTEENTITSKLATLNKQEQSLGKDIATLDDKVSKSEEELRSCADEHLRLGTLLKELDKPDYEPGKGLSDKIKKLLSAVNINTNSFWGDKVEVADGWEKALDLVATRVLQANFTDNMGIALESLAEEHDVQLGLIEEAVKKQDTQESFGKAKSLAQLIKHNNKPSFLNHIYSCDDLQQAIKLRKKLKSHQSIVTPRGDWIGPDWAVLQSANSDTHNPASVARKKRHAEIEKRTAKTLKQKESLTSTLKNLKDNQSSANETLNKLRDELMQIKQQSTKNEQLLIGKRVLFNELSELNPELWKKQKANLVEIDKQVIEYQKELLEAEATKNRQDEIRKQLEDNRTELTNKLSELQEQRQQQESRQQQEQERREELLTIKSSLETELITLRTSEEKNKLRTEELLQSTFVARNAVKQDDTKLAELTKSNDQLAKIIAAKEKEMDKLSDRLREVERNLSRGEKDIAVFEEKIDQSKGDEQQLELEMDELEKRIPTAKQTQSSKTLDEDLGDPSTIQTRINILQRANDRMGDVNMLALKDYKEEKEKYDHLLMQEQEINTALDNLNKAIKRIDRESKSRFDATFNKVNKSFGKLFSTLTQGGKGTLQVDTSEDGKNGIRIMASPPGKRNTMLSLLSGGEKTVTAIAFIMAIFQLNPAPFCLLDEADAMLDDQNINRFNHMMDEMAAAAEVQFIIITHSQLSMQNAKHLIGVTMSEPGVSRIVTVDMDKAVELSQADA